MDDIELFEPIDNDVEDLDTYHDWHCQCDECNPDRVHDRRAA